ncbi:MAG: ATP-binding cassette domain-containing protein [Eubacterium sp.]|nr:ATP-binding cassette domain-containing protein [Eubacterium sp.]
MGTLVEFQNVSSGYDRIKILNNLSFEVLEGEVFGVIGPNGCGKTTMLNTMVGLIHRSRGKIMFDGQDISELPPHVRCLRGIGRTFQVPLPFDKMTTLENVLVACVHGAGMSIKQGRDISEEILETVGLSDKASLKAGSLTLLDRKRLEIARALGSKPRLLLLDEVAAGLTEVEVQQVMDLVARLKSQNLTIIWIEHILDTMLYSTDRLMCMAEGRNVIMGDPSEVIQSDIVQELYLGMDEE